MAEVCCQAVKKTHRVASVHENVWRTVMKDETALLGLLGGKLNFLMAAWIKAWWCANYATKSFLVMQHFKPMYLLDGAMPLMTRSSVVSNGIKKMVFKNIVIVFIFRLSMYRQCRYF